MSDPQSFPWLFGDTPMQMGDAVAALILVEDDGYLMQLRDYRSDIWYPGHWGTFGGAVEPGETALEALKRELREELELDLENAGFLMKFDFDLSGMGLQKYYRSYFLVRISRTDAAGLVLHEGAEMRVFTGAEIVAEPRVSPYDHFALFLHHSVARFGVNA